MGTLCVLGIGRRRDSAGAFGESRALRYESHMGTSSASSSLATPFIASLTLGLAPFFPEPHIVGKIRWVAGGGVGMKPEDIFDLFLHGAPWVWLWVAMGHVLFLRWKSSPSASDTPS